MTPLARGRIKASPEDFVVEEIPAYEACGEGDHLFVRFTKRGLATDEAALRIARAAKVDRRDVGVAGMKDKVAVTTQTLSLPVPRADAASFEARVRALALDGIEILETRRHTNKLKTGHLAGNRFRITVRDIDRDRLDDVASRIQSLAETGLPNAFGAQRFGRARDNAENARVWLRGHAPAPRDPRIRRLLFSALQADLFNRVLDARVAAGTWNTPLPGDLAKRRGSHALFLWTAGDGATDADVRDPATPTGPMFGPKMRQPEGEPQALEQRIFAENVGQELFVAAAKGLGEGTRRPLRLWVEDVRVERMPLDSQEKRGGLTFYFVLPKGGYATSVLGTALAIDPIDGDVGASSASDPERTSE